MKIFALIFTVIGFGCINNFEPLNIYDFVGVILIVAGVVIWEGE